MGGYRSGRTKQHHTPDECISIDTTALRKHGLFTSNSNSKSTTLTCTIKSISAEGETAVNHAIRVQVKHYRPGQTGQFSGWDAVGHVTLSYGIKRGQEKPERHSIDAPLVITQPNYGGARYWLLAPCCGRRSRILYLPTYSGAPGDATHPLCRLCLDLHYASQQTSYIEKHIAYEKYLLANYGYTWACLRYETLKEHYFVVTPEWEYIKLSSMLTRELEILEHLIRANRVMLQTHAAQLRSLISVEDRLVFLDHYLKTQGKAYVLELVRMAGMEAQIQQDIQGLAPGEFERIISGKPAPDPQHEPISIQSLMERKKAIQEQLQQLKSAA